jgi:hypothetical protein
MAVLMSFGAKSHVPYVVETFSIVALILSIKDVANFTGRVMEKINETNSSLS